MMLSVLATAFTTAVLPVLPGTDGALPGGAGLPGLPMTNTGTRPGPPNRGVVEWVGSSNAIINMEVEQANEVNDDVSKQKWVNIPEWLHWSTAHLLTAGNEGMSLKLSCPAEGEGVPCTFHVVLYNCIPCSTAQNGGLPSEMLAQGFETGGCGPRYVPTFPFEPVNGEPYQTAIYKIEIASGGEPIVLPLSRSLIHGAVFELSMAQQCSLTAPLAHPCNAKENCVFNEGLEKCMDAPMCPMRFRGPVQQQGKKCKCFQLPKDD